MPSCLSFPVICHHALPVCHHALHYYELLLAFFCHALFEPYMRTCNLCILIVLTYLSSSHLNMWDHGAKTDGVKATMASLKSWSVQKFQSLLPVNAEGHKNRSQRWYCIIDKHWWLQCTVHVHSKPLHLYTEMNTTVILALSAKQLYEGVTVEPVPCL